MKISKFFKTIILILLLASIYQAYSISSVSGYSEYIADSNNYNSNNFDVGNIELNEEYSTKKITYKNTQNHEVLLYSNDIVITCKGKTYEDEVIAKENTFVKATFKTSKRESSDMITLDKNEVVDIYLSTKYSGYQYPEYPVNCDYELKVNIQ